MNSQQAIEQLKNLEKESRQAMKRGELKIATKIANDAKSNAPGSLPSGIYVEQTETETVIIGGQEIAAYVNYGTGNFAKEYVASLPESQQEEARKFFISGKGHGSPNPFFTNSIFRHEQEILPAIDEELQKLAK